jgi:hypothetical protein
MTQTDSSFQEFPEVGEATRNYMYDFGSMTALASSSRTASTTPSSCAYR